MNTSVSTPSDLLLATPNAAPAPDWRRTLGNALVITRREVRDSFRDWRIIGPIVILTFAFPALAQFVASQFAGFVSGFGAQIVGERMIPFLLMIVGFFPISISLVIALETFVGEKERRSIEPLLSTPLTNTELYIGKTLAAMIPPLAAAYGGMIVYLVSLLFGELAWRPQPALILQIILLTTVQALVMVTGAVVVSSQTTSTRAANLLASFIIIPMTQMILVETVIMFLAPDAESPNGIGALWAIIFGMIIAVILLLRVGNSSFNREELLGRALDQINLRSTIRRLWRSLLIMDSSGATASNIVEWYTRAIPYSFRHLRTPLIIAVVYFLIAFVGGFLFGQLPQYQLGLPRDLPIDEMGRNVGSYADVVFGPAPVFSIMWANGRILLGAAILGAMTFGVAGMIFTPLTYVVLGYLLSQLVSAGYSPIILLAALFPHGLIEIPVIVLATAVILRLGAVVTRPPDGLTVGQGWTLALGDTLKITLGVIIPGLFFAAVLEAYVTPFVVAAVLGG